jgi:hypothetical protein
MSSQGHPAGNYNDENNDDFDCPKKVLESDAPFERGAVDEECGGDAGETDRTLVPSGDFDLGGVKNVFSACPKTFLVSLAMGRRDVCWPDLGGGGGKSSGVQGFRG